MAREFPLFIDLLRNVDASVHYNAISASRGKAVRAQPVSALYEQGKIHHVGMFPELEDQLCLWVPESLESPDRLDACVWAISELRGLGVADWSVAYGTHRCAGCDRMFLLTTRDRGNQPVTRKACPHCSHLIEEDAA